MTITEPEPDEPDQPAVEPYPEPEDGDHSDRAAILRHLREALDASRR